MRNIKKNTFGANNHQHLFLFIIKKQITVLVRMNVVQRESRKTTLKTKSELIRKDATIGEYKTLFNV